MNRRRFLTALAAIPFLRRLSPKPAAPMTTTASEFLKRHYSPVMVVPAGGTITSPWVKFPMSSDLRYYGGIMLSVSGGSGTGTMTMEVSRDGKTWKPA